MNDIDNKQHVKIKTSTVLPSGEIRVKTESYFEELASDKTEVEQHIQTDKENFLRDIMTCLSFITDMKTNELTINIKTDDMRRPRVITRIYTLSKNTFNKR